MNTQKFTIGVISLAVAVILVTGVLIPVIGNSTQEGGPYTNEGYTFRYNLVENPTNIDIMLIYDMEGLTINSDDIQTNDTNAIVYADNNVVVCSNEQVLTVKIMSNGTTMTGDSVNVDIYQGDDGVEISDGEELDYTTPAPEWAFVANSEGDYGFFPDGTSIIKDEHAVTVSGVGTIALISGESSGSGVSPTTASMLSVIPLIVIVGLLIGAITMFVRRN